ncbi:hypothetical protein OW763_05485 [Clostridium aestuarii]|uniref:Phage protein n=1 Tax=Clostridium aestuarii TaxID=338193 RepID=A0ABT4D0B4_9CLOT|nr:hypothetical protein [Clostridium aestuarii]MCY6483800.1 hypothetical protein [Clostridium aestuarii]
MNIVWFDANKGIPSATVAQYGINLNNSAAEYLKSAVKIKLGYEEKMKHICIQSCDKNDTSGFNLPHMDDKVKNARISCREFIRLLSIKFGLDTTISDKYYCYWDEGIKVLVIDLNQKIPKKQLMKKIKTEEI